MKKRRSFSRQFKREAASMVLDQGFSYREVCRQLDLGETGLRRWVDQLRFERDGGVPQSKALTDEQQKIQELEAKIHRLEREKAILKKATALLVSDEINGRSQSGVIPTGAQVQEDRPSAGGYSEPVGAAVYSGAAESGVVWRYYLCLGWGPLALFGCSDG